MWYKFFVFLPHIPTGTTICIRRGTTRGRRCVACDRKRADPVFCRPSITVTVTATNFCPPNYTLPGDRGGWCNPPRVHFDMAQPAWEKIGVNCAGIIPAAMYKRCVQINELIGLS